MTGPVDGWTDGQHGLPRASVQQTGWLNTTAVYSLTLLEARSPKSRCWQSWFFLKVMRENPSRLTPSFWWLPAVTGIFCVLLFSC